MSQVHVVTGAGPVGSTIALQLAEGGQQVRLLTRSGSGPDHPAIERRRVDVSQPDQLADALEDATAVFHCIHGSAYDADVWRAELPRAEAAVMDAAGAVGAVVVFPESLYAYGRVDGPIHEGLPRDATTGKMGVRAELLRARAAHPTPTVSVVASDFLGPRVRTSHAGEHVVTRVLAGQVVVTIGRLDVPHSFTHVPDLARAMITAASREDLWDTVLHAPTAPAPTQRELVTAMAAAAGVRTPRLVAVPTWAMRAAGLVHRPTRELAEMTWQLRRPFVMESRASEERLGLSPTPLDVAVKETVAWWRERLGTDQA